MGGRGLARGGPGGRGAAFVPRGGKRKAPGDMNQGQMKKRNTDGKGMIIERIQTVGIFRFYGTVNYLSKVIQVNMIL